MRLISRTTRRFGTIALDWWWPEAGLVVWSGGEIRFKLWGRRLRGWLAFTCGLLLAASNSAYSGSFRPVTEWPLIPIHMSLLPDGRVLAYGSDGVGNQTGQLIYDVWNPADGSHLVLPNTTGTDIFCSAQTLIPTGELLITGGDLTIGGVRTHGNAQTNIFDPSTDDLQPDGQMAYKRWYASLVALPDGRAAVFGGFSAFDSNPPYIATPEVYDPSTRRWTVLPAAADLNAFVNYSDWFYPRAYVIPGGTLLVLTNQGALYSFDVNAGTTTLLPQTIPPGDPTLPAVEFSPGHILAIRAGGEAITIDATTRPMTIRDTDPVGPNRMWGSLSILADGQVLLTGGSGTWYTDARDLATASYQSAIWNPATGRWTSDAKAVLARLYHSNSLLLADASVVVAGGGAPGALNNLNAETYYPPYLYDQAGNPAPRPDLFWTPETASVGGWVWGSTSAGNNITRLTLVRMGSATHSNNSDQRFIELSPQYPNDQDHSEFYTGLPNDATVMVPGFYMMFAFNDAGVPSIGRAIHIQ